MKTEISETNEPNKFRLTLAHKLTLKSPNKIWHCLIQVFIIHEKTLNLNIITIDLNLYPKLE